MKLTPGKIPNPNPQAAEQIKLSGNIIGGMHRHLQGVTNEHLGKGFRPVGMPPGTMNSPDATRK